MSVSTKVYMMPGDKRPVLGFILILCLVDSTAQQDITCDFENPCNIVQDPTDNFDWNRLSGPTPSSRTGPDSGHGGTDYYVYIEATSKAQGESARISTQTLSGNTYCVEFAYHMYGSTVGELRLYKEKSGNTRSVVWSESGDKGSSWLTHSTTVNLGSGYNKIGWEGVRGTAYDGDIALDDISVKIGACGSSASGGNSCGFEVDFCRFIQDSSDDLDWERMTGATPSLQTGPDSGHQGSKNYIYLEATTKQPGQTARLMTFPLNDTTYCVEFSYHMYGRAMGELRLYKAGPGISRSVIWNESGDKGTSWITFSTTVTLGSGYNRLGWEGVRGRDYLADIALDDLSVTPGRCGGQVAGPCSSTPCLNGGVCSRNGNSYSCDCSSTGHSGSECQIASGGYSCDFEVDFCRFIQDSSDDLDWERMAGATPSLQTGPDSGHQGSKNYIYLEATTKQPEHTARLMTFPLTDTTYCVEFSYHMYGRSMGELRLYKAGPGIARSVIWSESGDKGTSWITFSTTVTLGSGYNRLGWEGVRGRDYLADIALDDLSVTPGRCGGQVAGPCSSSPCLNGGVCSRNGNSYSCDCSSTGHSGSECQIALTEFTCDFENDICGFLQDALDDFDWARRTGTTPSEGTGPDTGHQGSKYYIYIEATGKQAGQKARISTPPLIGSSIWCVQFAYHMYGSSIGRLSFYDDRAGTGYSWNATGDSGNSWRTMSTQLSGISGQKLVWEGVRGDDYTGDIALDDLSVKPGACKSSVPEGSDLCTPNTCANGGICSIRFGTYYCDCIGTGYTGTNCRIEINPCSSNPCSNGAACSSGSSSLFICDCTGTGHTGPRCQTPARNPCSPNPCLNGGKCSVSGNAYTCDCSVTTNFGPRCELAGHSCDFEDDFCSLVQDTSDRLDWIRFSGRTPSQNTGPDSGYQRSQYYIYLEATNRRQGDNARLSTPLLTGSSVWCVEFAYHMYGSSIGRLAFYLDGPGQRYNWSSSGNGGNTWKKWSTQITITSGQKLTWEGVRGRAYDGDIALDDISVTAFPCGFQVIDPCVSNPCLNGGLCLINLDPVSFTCDCFGTGYSGSQCQLGNGPCFPNPCSNGGTCSSNGNAIYCDCTGTGHTGLNCQDGATAVSCGKRQINGLAALAQTSMIGRIVGGQDSSYGKWPWNVLIGYDKYGDGKYYIKCVGVIISSELILTGAFCMKDNAGNDLTPSKIQIGIGFHDLDTLDSHQQTFVVSRYFIHPDYKGLENYLDSNIAVIRLTTPMIWNNYVRPICLPAAGEEPPAGSTCYSIGWGDTEGTGSDRFLQEVVLPLVPRSVCNQPRYYKGNVNDNMMCAGDDTRSVCDGDYGGGLYCSRADGSYVAYGIASIPGSLFGTCLYAPGLFTKVSRFVNWIEEVKQCTSALCENGGVCTVRAGAASCDCSNTRYTGDRCQTAKDVCSSGPCLNGGRCIVRLGTYSCDCSGTGFSGDICNSGRQCGLPVKNRPSGASLTDRRKSDRNGTAPAEIINGYDAEYGDWPWQVMVECQVNRTHKSQCGGALISDRWLLSAGHCVRCTSTSQYSVTVGQHRQSTPDSHERIIPVDRAIQHPNYIPGFDNDLALFRLASPVTWNDYIQPICLPPSPGKEPPPGTSCVATGWGLTYGTGNRNILQAARVPLLERQSCNRLYVSQLTENTMCAGTNYRTVCLGDSGSPLQCEDSDGRYTVYGITSRGPETCDLPGIFTRVSRYLDWIKRYV